MTRTQTLRLAAEASCDPRTVISMYEGKACRQMVWDRVAAAAKKLRLPVPPAPREP